LFFGDPVVKLRNPRGTEGVELLKYLLLLACNYPPSKGNFVTVLGFVLTAGNNYAFVVNFTERHGRVVNIPASYLGGSGFKSRSEDCLS
jgi:hypothetical protein